MKPKFHYFWIVGFLLLSGCGNNSTEKKPGQAIAENASASNASEQGNGIVGEWEQIYTCFDKNGNYTLESEEKKASGVSLGSNWFRFNADGSCLRDKDVKFKGTYSIQEKSRTKTLVIEGGDNLRYTIIELSDKELILGSDGAFIVFKRIK